MPSSAIKVGVKFNGDSGVLLWARTRWVKAGLPMRRYYSAFRLSSARADSCKSRTDQHGIFQHDCHSSCILIRPSPHCNHLIHWSFSWVSRVITWIAFPTAVVDQLPGEVRAIPAISPSPKTLVCLINRKNYQLSEVSVNLLIARRLKVKFKGKNQHFVLQNTVSLNKRTAIKTKRTRRYLLSGSTLQQRKAIL